MAISDRKIFRSSQYGSVRVAVPVTAGTIAPCDPHHASVTVDHIREPSEGGSRLLGQQRDTPIDVSGTGSHLPETWNETDATADVVEYDGAPSVKVGREFLLRR